MPINSKAKGKRGERELALTLTAAGFPARRGVQFQGSPDSPDVVCESLPTIHWECKHTQALRIYDAMVQAQEDAGYNKIPVVAHRRNDCEWLAILTLKDLLAILRELSVIELSKAFGAEP